MRILFVCHRFPYPPNRGGKIRPFNMIRHLGQRHSVTVASLAHTAEELEQGGELREYCHEIIAEVLPLRARWARAVAALPSGSPSSLAYFYSPRLRSRIVESFQRHPYDLIWVHCAFVAPYVSGLRAQVRILDFGDIDSAKWFDYSNERPFPLSLGYMLEARKLRRWEIRLATEFDQCTVTTENEKEEFSKFGARVPCTVIPNGVDFSYFQAPAKPKAAGCPVLAFLGRMDYYPNVEGIRYFVSQIYPAIRAAVPDAQLRIIGSNPIARVRKLARVPGVTVTGYVPDVREYLADVTVAVVPVRICRGTQNKMLESMSMGIPTVSTTQASKGVAAVAGRDFLAAADAQDFAKQVVRLLTDPDLREHLSTAGRRQVQANHSWSHSLDLLDRILQESFAERAHIPR